ncbi:MAG: glutaredoxin family protein [Candidatus Thermoplasmatota archaeon]|nr:glutaredoxin family protein [Candidatus Thermoplasmatota archaeon]MBS3801484.1 glutaredoxin family protein [Candidatus Thermoplasmatota archaeon]
MIEYTHVDGKDKGSIRLFALSTCVWCRKTKRLLDSLEVAYDYVYTDLLSSNERNEVLDEVEKWNPRVSFPTMVINNKKTIVGFKENHIREAIKG